MPSKYEAARARVTPLPSDQLNTFLAEPWNAILATINKNGTPQRTPVSFYWDGKAFYISTFKEAVKYKNIKRDPRISITVDEDEHFYPNLKTSRSVTAKGRADLL
jgi:PPOX class probable F420-dependent enzyme